jgi:DNA-binding IclR family transcriptional regulator
VASPSSAERSGTQSIERAVFLLREIASRSHAGWGLRDLAQHCGLDHGTVHRMLKCLLEQGLVRQRESDRRYFLGPLAFDLGLAVTERRELADAVEAALRRIVRAMPKISIVGFLRSGDDCLCVARAGYVPQTRAETSTRIGQRLPLLSKAAGVAIIAALRPEEARAVCARNRVRIAHLGAAHLAAVDEMVRISMRHGYALSEGLMWHDVNSIALAFGPPGDPLGSITISAWSGHHGPESLRQLLPELRAESAALAEAAARLS